VGAGARQGARHLRGRVVSARRERAIGRTATPRHASCVMRSASCASKEGKGHPASSVLWFAHDA
jgi:hypothetical protein